MPSTLVKVIVEVAPPFFIILPVSIPPSAKAKPSSRTSVITALSQLIPYLGFTVRVQGNVCVTAEN